MERKYVLFLEALRGALCDGKVRWDEQIEPQELEQVLRMAQEHHVLPLIFEAVYDCPAASRIDRELFAFCKGSTVQSVMTQAIKTEDFLQLEEHLQQCGVRPLVVKGIVCRELYPKPDYRFSGDEDVFCGEHQFRACHKALIDFGMEPCAPELDNYEVPYRKEDSSLYIELHKTMFAQDSPVFGDCNRFFEPAFGRCIEIQVQGRSVATMCPTDHMLYLIVHAFKHFLHSGFGIRQVCDMALFANAYGSQIDWDHVLRHCRGIRADRFAAALFRIGQKYLMFDPEKACYPRSWSTIEVDETALLEDMLYGGIYGSSDRSRVHSSNMTLNAVADDKKGKRAGKGLIRTVFPAARSIENRFPWLHDRPWLLPVAWGCRIFGYAKESISDPHSAAGDVIRTGSKRIELLREYQIID